MIFFARPGWTWAGSRSQQTRIGLTRPGFDSGPDQTGPDNEDPWEPMGTHGDPWGPKGNPWEPMGLMGPVGTHGDPWERERERESVHSGPLAPCTHATLYRVRHSRSLQTVGTAGRAAEAEEDGEGRTVRRRRS